MGCGKIARKFAADLPHSGNGRLVAVASREGQKAAEFATHFGADRFYASYDALASDAGLDAIYIATPHSHHHEHTLFCLEHGKAVLCEKAFAVNTRQALEMIDTARRNKVFLMEAMWTQLLPHYQLFRDLVKQGKVGDIRSVLVQFGFRPQEPISPRLFDPALAGGSLLDIGIYNVFVALTVLGAPDRIEASMTPAKTGVDEQCSIQFNYRNGAIAQLFSTFATDLSTEANIHGTKGRLRLGHRFYAPGSAVEYIPGHPETAERITVPGTVAGFGYEYEARHVGNCLNDGLLESPVITHHETLQRMEVLDEIRRKAGIVYGVDQ